MSPKRVKSSIGLRKEDNQKNISKRAKPLAWGV
jgi:hypothetical protein